MNSSNSEETTAAAPAANQPAPKKVTRRMADFYVLKTFGKGVRLRFQPGRPSAYAVVARQPGTSVHLVLGEGNTFGQAINAAIQALQPSVAPVKVEPIKPEEVTK